MTVIYSADSNPDPKTINPGLNTEDGFSISTAEIKTRSTWEAASPLGAVFRFGDDTDNPWVWEDDYMPHLFNQDIKLPWPEYLNAPTGTLTITFALEDLAPGLDNVTIYKSDYNDTNRPVSIELVPQGEFEDPEWWYNDILLGTERTLTLSALDPRYNMADHGGSVKALTLEVTVNGKPYSKTIEFTVMP